MQLIQNHCMLSGPKFVWCALLLGAVVAEGAAQDQADAAGLAEFLSGQLGQDRGLVLDVGCGNGALALALARRTKFQVECIETDSSAVAALRAGALEAGASRQICVKEGLFDPLPYPSNTASLIVCGDGFASGLRSRSLKEIYRVLSPQGVAMLGQASPAEGEKALSRAQLESWLRDAGVTTFTIIQEHGLWARVTKPFEPHWDEWPQRGHDAANTWSSRDAVQGEGFLPQWWTGCRPGTSSAAVLLGGGRLVLVGLSYKESPEQTPFIQVLDAFSGVELWAKAGVDALPLSRPPGLYSNRENCCDSLIHDQRLYVLGGSRCHVFALKDGSEMAAWPLPAEAEPAEEDCWLHLAEQGGLLYATCGPSPAARVDWNTMMYRGVSRALFCLDPKSGKVRWTHKAEFPTASLAIADGLLAYVSASGDLTALNAQSGEKTWSQPADLPADSVVARAAIHRDAFWVLFNKPDPKVGPKADAILTKGHNRRELAAFSLADGKRQFVADFGAGVAGFTFSGETVLGACQHADGTAAADAASGKLLWKLPGSLKCTPSLATPHYLVQRGGGLSPSLLDLAGMGDPKPKPRMFTFAGFRPSCSFPALPAYGRLFTQAEGCRCVSPLRGLVALAPAPVQTHPEPPGEPLVKGVAWETATQASPKPAWAGVRADASRSGRALETPSFPLKEAWRASDCQTAVAAADGKVFAAFGAQAVRALAAADGAVRWTSYTAGTIERAPFYAEGRVFVSDDEGWAHALLGDDGTLCWRYRAAPGSDRMVMHERYRSRLPSLCGVVVREGVAYFTAGYFPAEGTAVYAVDARTGELRWQQRYSATSGFKNGLVPCGDLAVSAHALLVPSPYGWATQIALDDEEHAAKPLAGIPGNSVCFVEESALGANQRLDLVWHVKWVSNPKTCLPVTNGKLAWQIDPNGGLCAYAWKVPETKYSKKVQAPKFPPSAAIWQGCEQVRLTQAIEAGGVVICGGEGKVFALDGQDGKELWSAEVRGVVADLAFHDGRLFVVTEGKELVCYSPVEK